MRDVSLHEHLFTLNEWNELPEGHLELIDGYITLGCDREALLKALLVNNGLIEVVRHAPLELWLEAIRAVYGDGGVAI